MMKQFSVEETRSPTSSGDNHHPGGTGVVRDGQCRRAPGWAVLWTGEARLVSRYLNPLYLLFLFVPRNSNFCKLEIHASILEIQTIFKWPDGSYSTWFQVRIFV
jgi:hypothetical protein